MKVIIKKLLALVLGALSQKQNKDWTLVAEVNGASTVYYQDLSARGYTEVYLTVNNQGGAFAPISTLPRDLAFGGYHSGPYGILRGATVTTTYMTPIWSMQDSYNALGSSTFRLYAR